MTTKIPYRPLPLELPAQYAHGPDSFPQPGVPRGELRAYESNESRVYPDTRRRYWVYLPAQYSPSEPASLIVFQDAEWYLDLDPDKQGGRDHEDRAPVVFDNLIHRGEMPVTIGVFVAASEHREAEYMACNDVYATFLLTEILPAVLAEYAITDDPNQWAVAGGSASGVCAFDVGWWRPDRFRRVLSTVGGFSVVSDNCYPDMIRRAPRKPLRIFLTTESRDSNWDQPTNNFLSENLKIAAALAERGYDFRLVLGDGRHGGNHSAVILPDALRWLWQPVVAGGQT